MMPSHVVFVPVYIPVAGQTWSKRTPQPEYPHQRREQWPARRQAIPTRDAQTLLDVARRHIANDRDQLKRTAREGRV
jgi:hypothetical protein